jgi:hypothetical protein
VRDARAHREKHTDGDGDMDALHSFVCGAGEGAGEMKGRGRGRGRVSTNTSIVTEALKAMQSGAGRGTGGASCKGELPEGTVVVCISVCLLLHAVY